MRSHHVAVCLSSCPSRSDGNGCTVTPPLLLLWHCFCGDMQQLLCRYILQQLQAPALHEDSDDDDDDDDYDDNDDAADESTLEIESDDAAEEDDEHEETLGAAAVVREELLCRKFLASTEAAHIEASQRSTAPMVRAQQSQPSAVPTSGKLSHTAARAALRLSAEAGRNKENVRAENRLSTKASSAVTAEAIAGTAEATATTVAAASRVGSPKAPSRVGSRPKTPVVELSSQAIFHKPLPERIPDGKNSQQWWQLAHPSSSADSICRASIRRSASIVFYLRCDYPHSQQHQVQRDRGRICKAMLAGSHSTASQPAATYVGASITHPCASFLIMKILRWCCLPQSHCNLGKLQPAKPTCTKNRSPQLRLCYLNCHLKTSQAIGPVYFARSLALHSMHVHGSVLLSCAPVPRRTSLRLNL